MFFLGRRRKPSVDGRGGTRSGNKFILELVLGLLLVEIVVLSMVEVELEVCNGLDFDVSVSRIRTTPTGGIEGEATPLVTTYCIDSISDSISRFAIIPQSSDRNILSRCSR